uniref:F-box domain-containing protein n=1 Tax=Elaeophora elaphi TaxID=1147741 RepID=A0A0R3RSR1_9BILA
MRKLSDDAKKEQAIECNEILSTLQQLPIILLAQILSNLDIDDQKHFADTCKSAQMAMKVYWNTCTDLHIGSLIKQNFSFINMRNRCSLHAIRRQITIALRLIPKFTLRRLSFQPIYSLHLQDLRDIEIRTGKSSIQIYGDLKHLDLRGCELEYDELHYFSNACTRLTSIALTRTAVFLPKQIFVDEDYIKMHKLEHPFKSYHNFLRMALPNFSEMEKRGEIRPEHTELMIKLLMLFPYLEIFHIE